eukprot:12220673-Karenia_brevis.AAC.1
MCSTEAGDVIAWRERMIQKLEEAASKMDKSGIRAEWLRDADDPIRAISGKANLQLFHTLLCASGYVDPGCVSLLCTGAEMLGTLERSGIGEPVDEQGDPPSEQELLQRRRTDNVALLTRLKIDRNADWLLEHTRKEAKAGRMSAPIPVNDM